MSKNKSRRRRRSKGTQFKGILMKIDGQLKPVSFNIKCEFCPNIETFPVRVPKPEGWKWTSDGQISFDVFYCCPTQVCVESALNKYRNALREGIVVKGEPPETLFPKEDQEE